MRFLKVFNDFQFGDTFFFQQKFWFILVFAHLIMIFLYHLLYSSLHIMCFQLLINRKFFKLLIFSSNNRMSPKGDFGTLKFWILFKEETQLKDYLEQLFFLGTIMRRKAFKLLIVLEDRVWSEMVFQKLPCITEKELTERSVQE